MKRHTLIFFRRIIRFYKSNYEGQKTELPYKITLEMVNKKMKPVGIIIKLEIEETNDNLFSCLFSFKTQV